MFKRLVATSRAPQIMVLSMLRSFGKIGPQIDQIWAWLSRGHRWSAEVRNPLKSSVTGRSLLVNCYLEIKFHKIIRVNPPPPLNPICSTISNKCLFSNVASLLYVWCVYPSCLISQLKFKPSYLLAQKFPRDFANHYSKYLTAVNIPINY